MIEHEIVICSAVVTTCGKIIRGHRHHNCLWAIKDMGLKPSENPMGQGFITSKNRYVTRVEGRMLQNWAGVKSVAKGGYRGNTLYSEDLY